MTQEQMADLIEELIAVDTNEGFVKESSVTGNIIMFETFDGKNYRVMVEQL